MEVDRAVWKLRVQGVVSHLPDFVREVWAREVFFQNLFIEASRALDLKTGPLYPRRGAANYSLLYLLLRAVTELPVKAVLELGVGESSKLLNALGSRHEDLRVLSLESDPSWADRLGRAVTHDVRHAPLVSRTVHGKTVDSYSADSLPGPFDLVLVDGPRGSRRHSRWGALELLDQYLADEFMVVFDDAERFGEQDMIAEFLKCNRDRPIRAHILRGTSTQLVAYTEEFAAVRNY